MKHFFRLLPIAIALVVTMLVASCMPQKQYGCPNHLEAGTNVE